MCLCVRGRDRERAVQAVMWEYSAKGSDVLCNSLQAIVLERAALPALHAEMAPALKLTFTEHVRCDDCAG